jgi:uncharacterized membrane protein YfcA
MSNIPQPANARASLRQRWRRTLLIDVVLPFAAVQIFQRFFAVPAIPAFAIAAIFPAVSVIVEWARAKRVDWIGLLVLVGFGIGIATALLTDQIGFAALRGAPLFALFGIAALASLGSKKPLMFFVARAVETQGDPEKAVAWNARLDEPRFRAVMRRVTLVWGIACIAEAMLGAVAAFLLPPSIAIVAEPVLALLTIAGLLAWTYSLRPAPAPAATAANTQ